MPTIPAKIAKIIEQKRNKLKIKGVLCKKVRFGTLFLYFGLEKIAAAIIPISVKTLKIQVLVFSDSVLCFYELFISSKISVTTKKLSSIPTGVLIFT